MFGQSLLSAFGIACTTDTDQLFATDQSVTSTATYQLNNATTSIPSNTYPGTASNITYTTGKFGNAAVFNGSSSVIDVSSSAINVGTPYTISMWLNFSDVTAYKGVFANITSSRLTNEIAVVLNNGKITIYSVVSNGNTSLDAINATPQSAIANNTWYNVVIVADRSLANKAKVYFNSVETSYTYSAGVASTAAYSDTKIGLADGQYFDGLIDQVRFFASSLPQAAITALYNETTTTATSASVNYQLANPNSIAYYKMSNATDQINNYNFTAYNVNFNVEGKFGFAGEFSGSTSSYMTRSNSFLPTGNASRSFSFWTKLNTHTNDAYFMSYGNGAVGQFFSPRVTPVSQGGYISFMGFGADLNSNVVMTTGEWMHLCYTYDGTTLKIYKNAIEIGSGNLTLNTSQTRPFIMGARDFNASITKPIDGLIDQVRIYDSAISAADVTTLYKEIECEPAAINALANFNTVIYTGSGSQQVGFKPGFTWIKNRDSTPDHVLFDTIRGVQKFIRSNNNDPEATGSGASGQDYLSSFNTNGFTVGNASNTGSNSVNYVAWNWKAALANLSTSFNGTTSRIELPKFPTLTGNVSVSGWVKLGNTATSNRLRFVELNLDNAGYAGTLQTLYKPSNGEWLVRVGNGTSSNTNVLTHTYQLTQGVWYNICFTRNTSTNVTTFYVNNVQQDQETVTASASFPANATSIIGDVNYSTSYQYNWLGEMNQIRIFDDVLTTNEISDLYTEPAASNNTLNYPAGAGCIAAYPLQTDAVDLSGNYSGTSSNVTFGQPGYLTSNTDGTITSTVAVNTEAGFSVVKYTGNGSAGAKIGHGLGVKPELFFIKNLTATSGSRDWIAWCNEDNTALGYLNYPDAFASSRYSWALNSTQPTSTNITFSNDPSTNGSFDYIAYCFVSIPGYSRIGSYIGTGGAFTVYTGFAPSFVMIKRSDSTGNWVIIDNKRGGTSRARLYPNLSNAGDNNQGDTLTSNGFSPRPTPTADTNINGGTFIYLAIA